jgi:hypothetical protein
VALSAKDASRPPGVVATPSQKHVAGNWQGR